MKRAGHKQRKHMQTFEKEDKSVFAGGVERLTNDGAAAVSGMMLIGMFFVRLVKRE